MLLSPVVVALIWKWILQRDGLINAAIISLGGEKIIFFVDPSWAILVSISAGRPFSIAQAQVSRSSPCINPDNWCGRGATC